MHNPSVGKGRKSRPVPQMRKSVVSALFRRIIPKWARKDLRWQARTPLARLFIGYTCIALLADCKSGSRVFKNEPARRRVEAAREEVRAGSARNAEIYEERDKRSPREESGTRIAQEKWGRISFPFVFLGTLWNATSDDRSNERIIRACVRCLRGRAGGPTRQANIIPL